MRTGTRRSAMRSASAIAALVSEIRQRHDDAVDLVAVGAEQVGALPRFGAGLHGAVLGLFGREADRLVAGALDGGDHLLAAGLREMVREKAAVADN